MVRTCKSIPLKNAGRYPVCWLAFLFLAVACRPAPAQNAVLIWEKRGTVRYAAGIRLGLTAADTAGLQVRLRGSATPVLGIHAVNDGSLVFTPVVPLQAGNSYGVFSGDKQLAEVRVPLSGSVPRIVSVFPRADTLPENILKFYIRFSEPMQDGSAARRVSLRDEHGKRAADVFLLLEPELWNDDNTELTLWLDPGRIKRGLQLNEHLGNPLIAGKRYQLVIESGWKSRSGSSLRTGFNMPFTAGSRYSKAVDLKSWGFRLPQSGTRGALTLLPGRIIDRNLLMESITISRTGGDPVPGRIGPGKTILQWAYKPRQAWKKGVYRLRAAARLEDVAGNNMNRAFDRDITREKATGQLFFETTFTIR